MSNIVPCSEYPVAENYKDNYPADSFFRTEYTESEVNILSSELARWSIKLILRVCLKSILLHMRIKRHPEAAIGLKTDLLPKSITTIATPTDSIEWSTEQLKISVD